MTAVFLIAALFAAITSGLLILVAAGDCLRGGTRPWSIRVAWLLFFVVTRGLGSIAYAFLGTEFDLVAKVAKLHLIAWIILGTACLFNHLGPFGIPEIPIPTDIIRFVAIAQILHGDKVTTENKPKKHIPLPVVAPITLVPTRPPPPPGGDWFADLPELLIPDDLPPLPIPPVPRDRHGRVRADTASGTFEVVDSFGGRTWAIRYHPIGRTDRAPAPLPARTEGYLRIADQDIDLVLTHNALAHWKPGDAESKRVRPPKELPPMKSPRSLTWIGPKDEALILAQAGGYYYSPWLKSWKFHSEFSKHNLVQIAFRKKPAQLWGLSGPKGLVNRVVRLDSSGKRLEHRKLSTSLALDSSASPRDLQIKWVGSQIVIWHVQPEKRDVKKRQVRILLLDPKTGQLRRALEKQHRQAPKDPAVPERTADPKVTQ